MFDALAYPFMQRALAAGVLVGVMTSLLGVLVVLRRSAFFGDAIAHAALTGVATIPNTDITGLGTMSVQNANAVAITGGTIDGITLDGGTF